jgi:hypothetical protein
MELHVAVPVMLALVAAAASVARALIGKKK